MKIALVNCATLPEPDHDEAPLLAALRAAGHEAETAPWDSTGVEWSKYDAAVIRATWDYHESPAAFESWVVKVSEQTMLINAGQTVRWNMHKEYLRDFESRRIPIVPTLWAPRDSSTDCIGEAKRKGWGRVVIKPCISAGSRDTYVVDIGTDEQTEGARTKLDKHRLVEDMMVQRYMPSVADGGETAMITIGGKLSHAIQKFPRFDGQHESVRAQPEISEEERRFAQAVLDACPFSTLYARVDIMRDEQGGIVLSELELIEPSLYFAHGPGSAERMVKAIEAWVG